MAPEEHNINNKVHKYYKPTYVLTHPHGRYKIRTHENAKLFLLIFKHFSHKPIGFGKILEKRKILIFFKFQFALRKSCEYDLTLIK